MSISHKLAKFLKRHKVPYELQAHPQTFTACETAQCEHIPGRRLAKPVMVKIDGKDAMVVVPSNRTVDLLKLGTVLVSEDIRVVREPEFKNLFPECEAGAMPPFGPIYGVPCYADERLWEEDVLYFNAGNHQETVSILTSDFFRVAKAIPGDFSVEGKKIAASRFEKRSA